VRETATSARIFRFGVFEVDAATGELRKRGLRIHLQEQPAQFLLLLLDRAGEVVSREEIRRNLWPPDTFVDFDQGLGAALRKLRQALGDDAETPRYIETIPKRGFRFLAPVERISAMPEGAAAVLPIRAIEPPAPEVDREPPQTRRHYSAWWAVVAVPCVLSFVLGWLLHIGRAAPVGLHVTAYTQITHDGVPKTLIGTDGSRLYFDRAWSDSIGQVAVSGGAISNIQVSIPYFAFPEDVSEDGSNFLIATNEKGFALDRPQWNVRVPGGSLHRLPDGGGAAFSPDGNSVAFQTAEGELWTARSDGSGAHRLASGQSFPSRRNHGGRIDSILLRSRGLVARRRAAPVWESRPAVGGILEWRQSPRGNPRLAPFVESMLRQLVTRWPVLRIPRPNQGTHRAAGDLGAL
jgi:DNA-binding winged helix-turn-helix (wHTH) protein